MTPWCVVCGRYFKTEETLRSHMATHAKFAEKMRMVYGVPKKDWEKVWERLKKERPELFARS